MQNITTEKQTINDLVKKGSQRVKIKEYLKLSNGGPAENKHKGPARGIETKASETVVWSIVM